MANLECSAITKRFGKKEVLKGIDLTIEPGKIYGLVGRNGVGKTTLLSVMTAQAASNEGTVTYDGQPVWENRDALDHLCFSRELNTMTSFGPNNQKIKEYFRLAALYYPNWDQAYADELMKRFGINTKQIVCKMSKGMLSMVTITIGLASKADITILDEPVAGLDVVAREDFYKELLEEQGRTGRTFIISTHIIEEAADLFEEVIIMKDGKVFLQENTVDLLERAAHVTGLEEEVDRVTEGLEIYHEEKMGRSKGVTVLLKEGQTLPRSGEVTIQPISLQNLFVALCGRDSE
ncbi:MAG: ABC transporter ATP-binding protein [Acetatifactor sp.]|nr:ABC transporter ATP-binding protein [Acetatifactor sp.]